MSTESFIMAIGVGVIGGLIGVFLFTGSILLADMVASSVRTLRSRMRKHVPTRMNTAIAEVGRIVTSLEMTSGKRPGRVVIPAELFDHYYAALQPAQRFSHPSDDSPNLMFWNTTVVRGPAGLLTAVETLQ